MAPATAGGADCPAAGKGNRPKLGRGVANALGTVYPVWDQRQVNAANRVGHVTRDQARAPKTDVLPDLADKPPGLGTAGAEAGGCRGMGL